MPATNSDLQTLANHETTNDYKPIQEVRIHSYRTRGERWNSFIHCHERERSTPTPTPEATPERLVVTGSLIPTAEEVTANPVDIFTSADIQRSGEATDILQVLEKRDPDFVGVGNIGQTNANIFSINGASAITIRGLPTLVLFENRRFANNATVALGTGEFSDVSMFPTAL